MTSRHIDRQFVICLHLHIVLGLAELATMLHVIIVMVSYNVQTLIQRNAADDLGFLLLHDILKIFYVLLGLDSQRLKTTTKVNRIDLFLDLINKLYE